MAVGVREQEAVGSPLGAQDEVLQVAADPPEARAEVRGDVVRSHGPQLHDEQVEDHNRRAVVPASRKDRRKVSGRELLEAFQMAGPELLAHKRPLPVRVRMRDAGGHAPADGDGRFPRMEAEDMWGMKKRKKKKKKR